MPIKLATPSLGSKIFFAERNEMAGACAAAAVNRSAVAVCVLAPPARLFHEARGRERACDHGPDVDPATPWLMRRLGTAIESRPRPEHRSEIRH
jgi:hypothetical protein